MDGISSGMENITVLMYYLTTHDIFDICCYINVLRYHGYLWFEHENSDSGKTSA